MYSTPWSTSALITISAPVMARVMSLSPLLGTRPLTAPWQTRRGQEVMPGSGPAVNKRKAAGGSYSCFLRADFSPRNHIAPEPSYLALDVLPGLGNALPQGLLPADGSGHVLEQRPHSDRPHDGQL